ncbi:MAG: AI-2E family transporter [Parafannyhessea sp.]|uniref:AI-2E family transporter n=1 Tax=Parafannyhessea sp. TaxID=2847324 RepID=UPI003F085511
MVLQGEENQEAGRPDRLGRAKAVGVRAWAFIGVAIVFVICVRAMGYVWPAVELLLAGVIMGFVCSPLTNFLEDHGMGRALGALLSVLVLIAVMAIVIVLLTPPFVQQLADVLGKVPAYVEKTRVSLNDFWTHYGNADTRGVQQSVNQLVSTLSGIGIKMSSQLATKLSTGLVSSAFSFVNGLVTMLLGLVLAYWFAKDYPKIAREFSTIAGPRHEQGFSVLLAVMSRSMGGYMRGIVITSVFDGVVTLVFLTLAGHPYAGLSAILVGFLHFIPVIGEWVAVAFAVLVALFDNPMLALATLVGSIVIQNVTDNVVSPLVMRSAVKIHPALSLLGLIIGNCLGGILGMVLAVPLTAAIKSVFVYYFETSSGRRLVSYDGAIFQGTPFHDERGQIEPAFDALDDDSFFEGSRLVDATGAKSPVADEPPKGRRGRVSDLVLRAARRLDSGGRHGGDRAHDEEKGD